MSQYNDNKVTFKPPPPKAVDNDFDKKHPKTDTEYYIKESALETLYVTREPVLMGHYKGDAIYAAIFSEMEQKYPLEDT